MNNPKSANVSMGLAGIVAILLGPTAWLCTTVIYKLPVLTSISESATVANRASVVLPICLGICFLFAACYTGYTLWERIVVKIAGCGLLLVALQPCRSSYLDYDRIGFFGLPVATSDLVHCIGAAVGFGFIAVWVLFFFTRSDKPISEWTKQKHIRNYIYALCGGAIIMALVMFILSMQFVDFGPTAVFWAEQFLLTPTGIALIVKSGLILKDKEPQEPDHIDIEMK